MALAKGSKSKVSFWEEATFNTLPAVTSQAFTGVSYSSESLVENINKVVSDEIRSDRATPNIRGGNIAAGGGISNDFGPNKCGLLLKHLLGSVATTTIDPAALAVTTAYVRGDYRKSNARTYLCVESGTSSAAAVSTGLLSTSGQETEGTSVWEYIGAYGASSLKKHAITPGDLPAAGLLFEKQILGQSTPLVLLFSGCRVNSLGLNIQQEGIVRADWNILSMKAHDKAAVVWSQSISTPSDSPFVGAEVFVSFNGGATSRPVREATLNISNGIEENIYVIGSRHRRDVPEGRREISGNLTTYFEDRTEYDFFKNETEVSVVLSFNRAGQLLVITMPKVKLTGSGTPQVSGAGVLTAQYAIDAFKTSNPNDITVDIYTYATTLL